MTTETPNTYENGVERRDFLKSASVAGVGAIGIRPDDLGSDAALGETVFAEAGFTYDVRSEPTSGSYARANIDELVRHTIDATNGRLYLRQSIPDMAVGTFRRNEAIVTADRYRSLPDTAFDSVTESLPTVTGNSYRRLETLNLTETVQRPAVDVTRDGTKLTVAVEGNRVTVPPEKELQVDLDSHDVEAKVVEVLDETVDRPDIPDYRKAKKQIERTETATVVPTLAVRNYGEIQVFDATDQHFVQKAHR